MTLDNLIVKEAIAVFSIETSAAAAGLPAATYIERRLWLVDICLHGSMQVSEI